MTQAQPPGADALGHRARIGLLVPASNTIAQPELELLAPVGVTNQVARMRPTPPGKVGGNLESYRDGIDAQVPVIAEAISMALHTKPSALILAHSMDTFRGALDGARMMQERLDACAAGTPMVLPSLAYLAALKALGLGPGARVAAITPYWPPEDAHVDAFFSSAGYKVTRVLGLKRQGAYAIAATTAAEFIAGLRELAKDAPDVIVQPGTNLASVKLAAEASQWLGVPVLPCNTASYWHALRTIGIMDKMHGFGALFSEH